MQVIASTVFVNIHTSPLSQNIERLQKSSKLPPKYFFSCFSDSIVFCFHLLVDGGHRAVIFDRFQGVKPDVVGEGTHFLIPWVQRPIIFDIRTKPRNVPVTTGSKGICLYNGLQKPMNYVLLSVLHLSLLITF